MIAAIRRTHLKANIDIFERDPAAAIQWDRAWLDPGGTIFGPGPYLHVPVTCAWPEGACYSVQRVYAPARVRRRLARAWSR